MHDMTPAVKPAKVSTTEGGRLGLLLPSSFGGFGPLLPSMGGSARGIVVWEDRTVGLSWLDDSIQEGEESMREPVMAMRIVHGMREGDAQGALTSAVYFSRLAWDGTDVTVLLFVEGARYLACLPLETRGTL